MYDCIVYISRNMIDVINLKTGEIATEVQILQHKDFLSGITHLHWKLLAELVKKVASKGMLAFIRPKIIIQPLDMVEVD